MKKLIALFFLTCVAIWGFSQEGTRITKINQQKATNENIKSNYWEQDGKLELEKLEKMAASLPKEKQQIFYSQFNLLKNQIEQAENEAYKWKTREDLAKEMNSDGDGAKYAAAFHGIFAAVKKENAEEKIEDAKNKMALLEDALRIAYERSLSIQSTQEEKSQNESVITMTNKSNHSNPNVINHESPPEVHNQNQEKELTEGGHLLSGQSCICFITDPSMQNNKCRLYSIKNVKYILLNEATVSRINDFFVKKVTELNSGEYSISEIIGDNNASDNRNRDEVIPSNSHCRNQRGL